ncbi:hypothetical protein KP509_07G092200 [Ceratopteris richardii]|uniref:J domain-containing protein required for chloroplast accumulation response 1 n=1 Tax=Ceratopteris richardii TaxID=49495 RepID=A0A8T2UEN0_CERRI|nr:hypothetical protein KP509_07G092200 [Ceratopteris richardii]
MENNLRKQPAREVDYQDVFGGPPRYATLVSAHSGEESVRVIKNIEATSRTSSFPVYDLPPFGERTFYRAQANPNVRDITLDDGASISEYLFPSKLSCGTRSSASTLSSWQHMSLAHSSIASVDQLAEDNELDAETRGRLSNLQGSHLSSFSFDESEGKFSTALLYSRDNNSFSSSLPSSPPCSGLLGHTKSLERAYDAINMRGEKTLPEVDYSFDGYPQKDFSEQFSAVPHDFISMSTCKTESHGVIKLKSKNLAPNFVSVFSASDISAELTPRICSTKHVKNEGQRMIYMANQTKTQLTEKSGLPDTKSSLLAHGSSVLHNGCSENLCPTSTSITPLKYKSWKDLIADVPPASQSGSSKPFLLSNLDLETHSVQMALDNDVVNAFLIGKQMATKSQTEGKQPHHSSIRSQKEEVKLVGLTIDREERDFQGLLVNHLKDNKEVENANSYAKFTKRLAKHSMRNINTWNIQQQNCVNQDEKKIIRDSNHKEQKKLIHGDRKQWLNSADTTDGSSATISLQTCTDKAQYREKAKIISKASEIHNLPDGASVQDSVDGGNKQVFGELNIKDLSLKGYVQGEFGDFKADDCFYYSTDRLSQDTLENLDSMIRKWAAGKESNLRALLSNLQHVLWLECGWHPIPLSDLIEVPDVKKAFKRATLLVHPDKLQQKGATMQQKYIAERVYDILQEAWRQSFLQEYL